MFLYKRLLPLIISIIAFNACVIKTSAQRSEGASAEKITRDTSGGVTVMRYRISDALVYEYEKPKQFAFAKNIIPSTGQYFKRTFVKKNFIYIGGFIAATATLCLWDRAIIDAAQNTGDALGIAHTNNQKTYARLTIDVGNLKQPIPLNGPHDASTCMYFLGDGITHLTIACGFWVAGIAEKDYRARQTASQLAESIIATGIFVQFLKHITGRESPFAADFPIGKWRPFPNQADYAKHVPHYDAFPSGHLATAMATVTVIADNYPEYRYIRPLGYSLMTVLGFAMLNNGVHWFSDYPIALTIGYTFAKIADERGRKVIEKRRNTEEDSEPQHSKHGKILVLPQLSGSVNGLTMIYSF